MLTEQTLADLRRAVEAGASNIDRAALLNALDDTYRAVATQALLIRTLTMDLRNRGIGQDALDRLFPAAALDNLAARLGGAAHTPFSLSEAERACAALTDQAAHSRDLVATLAAIARVVAAFI